MSDIESPIPSLGYFKVTGLFDRFDVTARLEKNRLILVGENGSGKSTLVNILYYFLTCQWRRLRRMPFQRLEVMLDDVALGIEIEQLQTLIHQPSLFQKFRRELRRMVGPIRIERIERELANGDFDDALNLLTNQGVPSRFAHEFLHTAMPPGNQDELSELSSRIDELFPLRVLYLPTYRRIEHDLQSIFPELSLDKELTVRRQTEDFYTRRGFVELVEFGMNDVEEAFKRTTTDLDRRFRFDLNRLTASYLRDIIQGKHLTSELDSLFDPTIPVMLDDILGRMDDAILPPEDRQKLKQLIRTVQRDQVQGRDRVTLHFVSMLISIYEEQKKREESVTDLAKVCNNYLSDKELHFDAQQFELYLRRKWSGEEEPGARIPASGLSSGEKQIVSLFTHMYLDESKNYFVIIDEPELSISVPWQRTFLEDVMKTGRCSGLVAVTHSPFIFENDLQSSAHAISEFTELTGQ